jgi:hypothetical protein
VHGSGLGQYRSCSTDLPHLRHGTFGPATPRGPSTLRCPRDLRPCRPRPRTGRSTYAWKVDRDEHRIGAGDRGLRKRYGTFVAVDGVDITVSEGEIYGVLGPTAAARPPLSSARLRPADVRRPGHVLHARLHRPGRRLAGPDRAARPPRRLPGAGGAAPASGRAPAGAGAAVLPAVRAAGRRGGRRSRPAHPGSAPFRRAVAGLVARRRVRDRRGRARLRRSRGTDGSGAAHGPGRGSASCCGS